MARSEARVSVDIWAPESDFTDLTADAQWMYFFLLSQPDLAHTGVLALRERRWSRAAHGLTVEAINNRLAELAAARYVVIDEQTEELLVRSFIRRDKVYRQPQVLRNAADQLPLVISTALRRAIAVELTRVSQEPMPEPSSGILAEMLAALPNPADYPAADPPDQGAGEAARTGPGERGEVTAVRSASPYPVPRSPGPRSPIPGTTPLATLASSSARAEKPRDDGATVIDDPTAMTGALAGRQDGQASDGLESPATEGPGPPGTLIAPRPGGAPKSSGTQGTRVPNDFEPSPDLIEWARENAPTASRADHEAFMDYWRSVPGAKGRKLDWGMTWRNWMRKEHERRNSNPRASPTGKIQYNGLLLNPKTIEDLEGRQRMAALDAAEHASQQAIEGRRPS